uniref:Uncharacterized protein n=1 Tax=Sphaerodactylus townsendi TaxID=933632 RepID=A0ACB8FBW1_9SAUR
MSLIWTVTKYNGRKNKRGGPGDKKRQRGKKKSVNKEWQPDCRRGGGGGNRSMMKKIDAIPQPVVSWKTKMRQKTSHRGKVNWGSGNKVTLPGKWSATGKNQQNVQGNQSGVAVEPMQPISGLVEQDEGPRRSEHDSLDTNIKETAEKKVDGADKETKSSTGMSSSGKEVSLKPLQTPHATPDDNGEGLMHLIPESQPEDPGGGAPKIKEDIIPEAPDCAVVLLIRASTLIPPLPDPPDQPKAQHPEPLQAETAVLLQSHAGGVENSNRPSSQGFDTSSEIDSSDGTEGSEADLEDR